LNYSARFKKPDILPLFPESRWLYCVFGSGRSSPHSFALCGPKNPTLPTSVASVITHPVLVTTTSSAFQATSTRDESRFPDVEFSRKSALGTTADG
jgi:hypothetical protein